MFSSRLTRIAVTAAACALTSTALGGAPALAAPTSTAALAPASINLQVVDSLTEQPVANIDVYAIEAQEGDGDSSYIDFGATNSNGQVKAPGGGYAGSHKLTAGAWHFYYADYSQSRHQTGTSYAYTEQRRVLIQAGTNDLGQQPVDLGGTVSGTARTPHGQPLTDLSYEIDTQGTDPESDDGYSTGGQTESGDATYAEFGLPIASYDVLYDSGANGYSESDNSFRPATSFEITTPGQHATADLTVRVDSTPGATTLAGSSPARGTAQLVFKIANTFYDITDPHGVVTVMSAAGKTIGEPVPVTEVNGHGQATITFPATSTSHTYRAYYSTSTDNPADLRSTSRTTRLTVK